MAALFCVKLRHGRHLQTLTPNRKSHSFNQWAFTWRRTIFPNFISRSKLKHRSHRLCWRDRPKENKKKNKMSSDMRSVPDLKSLDTVNVRVQTKSVYGQQRSVITRLTGSDRDVSVRMSGRKWLGGYPCDGDKVISVSLGDDSTSTTPPLFRLPASRPKPAL